ncbi:NAD-dependent epimerase/dehydratase family protein [Aureimonas psammosilenae]|uniref:NAD-dependent epimerase/dehydratase family protein n=1 Tax=Aureimonas psammosilenae TaxID=2495496 RepID=UPI001F20A67F|nr:NAD-dependent epimerase/dehydratase family protein [Aureimonas psammosilenae]
MANGDLVLVTGMSGFIAKHIVMALLDAGFRVRGTVRFASKREHMLKAFRQAGADVSRIDTVKADLLQDEGWEQAAAGCRYVLHVASPFPRRAPVDKFGLVDVARSGTLRVLFAAARTGAERVVVTSSVAAVYYGHEARRDTLFGEADFSDVGSASIGSYAVSKTLAERAAWEFAASNGLQLATVNPSVVLGPLLDNEHGTSVDILRMMMRGHLPFVPRIGIGVVDVRDVAEAHIRAMTHPEAAGRRFIVDGGNVTLVEAARVAGEAVPTVRGKLPKGCLPDFAVRVAGRFSTRARQIVPELGRIKHLDVEPARSLLGLSFRCSKEAIRATAESLFQRGLV